MPNTTNLGIPYPAATDAPDAPGAFYAMAQKIDANSATARIAGFAGIVTHWDRSSAGHFTQVSQSGWIVAVTVAVQLVDGSAFSIPNIDLLFGFTPAPPPLTSAFGIVSTLSSSGTLNGTAVVEAGTDGSLHLRRLDSSDPKVLAGTLTYTAATLA